MRSGNEKRISYAAIVPFLLIAIVCTCVCIVFLGTDSYAWFFDGMKGDNSVKGSENASMLSISVYKSDEAEALVTLDAKAAATLSAAEGEYTVKLTLPKQSASGYLVILAGESEYRSACLQRSETSDQEMTFKINVNTAQNVKLTARWGTHSETPDVQGGGTLNIK